MRRRYLHPTHRHRFVLDTCLLLKAPHLLYLLLTSLHQPLFDRYVTSPRLLQYFIVDLR